MGCVLGRKVTGQGESGLYLSRQVAYLTADRAVSDESNWRNGERTQCRATTLPFPPVPHSKSHLSPQWLHRCGDESDRPGPLRSSQAVRYPWILQPNIWTTRVSHNRNFSGRETYYFDGHQTIEMPPKSVSDRPQALLTPRPVRGLPIPRRQNESNRIDWARRIREHARCRS